jgi:hypothetical protein
MIDYGFSHLQSRCLGFLERHVVSFVNHTNMARFLVEDKQYDLRSITIYIIDHNLMLKRYSTSISF